MISKILIIGSFVLILLGLIGVRTNSVKRKLLFLLVSIIGMLWLPFAQGNQYGMIGGLWQAVFQIPGGLCFILLIQSICRQNNIQKVEELAGVRQGMPYLFAAGVIFAVVLMGLPGTGAFTGYLYSSIGLMFGEVNVFDYIGLSGIFLGVVVSAAITFSILKAAYLSGPKKQKLSSKAGFVFVFLALLFILCCVFQNQVIAVVGKIFS